ncbi:ATP-binding cassette sub-family G member 8 [Trichonephila clavipes]|nr:ATP-binding cassette sub-family G member 8 [Trichonephila clavipes]
MPRVRHSPGPLTVIQKLRGPSPNSPSGVEWKRGCMASGITENIPPLAKSDFGPPNEYNGTKILGAPSTLSDPSGRCRTTEDLHAWSIYRQNLNSDFTDSALDTGHKSQPPFGNFRLRESTVQTILNHPKYGPRERNSELGSNVFTYLRFGLPRVLPHPPAKPLRNGSSGYDSSDDNASPYLDRGRRTRSDPDFRNHVIPPGPEGAETRKSSSRLKACSEADLLAADSRAQSRQQIIKAREDAREGYQRNPMPGNGHAVTPGSKAGSHLSVNSRMSPDQSSYRSPGKLDGFYHDAPMLNERFFPKDSFYSTLPGASSEGGLPKYPHLQVRDLSYELDMSSAWHTLCGGARTKLRMLEGLSFEVRGGEILAIMATTGEKDFNDVHREITDFVQSIPGFQECEEDLETWMACDAEDWISKAKS